MDLIEPWESAGSGERYPPCRTIVYEPTEESELEVDKRHQDMLRNSLPDAKLDLEWVYGYRGIDCQDNVHWLSEGSIVYFTAATAVVFDLFNHKQSFFSCHSDDIVCLTVFVNYVKGADGRIEEADVADDSPDLAPTRRIAASGEVGRYPLIYVWDTDSKEILARIPDPQDEFRHIRQVRGLAFSRDGKTLVSYGCDDAHTLAAYDWAANPPRLKFKRNAHMSDLSTVKFNPYSTGLEFVTVGDKHTKFWDAKGEGQGQNGLFGQLGTTQFVYAVAFIPTGQTLTGVADGSIYLWDGGAIVHTIPNAHNGAHAPQLYDDTPIIRPVRTDKQFTGCTALKYIPGAGVVSGGKDGWLFLWDFVVSRTFPVSGIELKWDDRATPRYPVSIDYIPFNGRESNFSRVAQTRLSLADGWRECLGLLLIGTATNEIVIVAIRALGMGQPLRTAGQSMRGMPAPTPQAMLVRIMPEFAPDNPEEKIKAIAQASKCCVMQGHWNDVTGLDCHPLGNSKEERVTLFASCGQDNTIRIWDYMQKRMIINKFTKEINHCCAWKVPDGEWLAVGQDQGVFSVYPITRDKSGSVEIGKAIARNKDRREDISDVRFSPDVGHGQYLGVASRDNFIDLYDANIANARDGIPEKEKAHIGATKQAPVMTSTLSTSRTGSRSGSRRGSPRGSQTNLKRSTDRPSWGAAAAAGAGGEVKINPLKALVQSVAAGAPAQDIVPETTEDRERMAARQKERAKEVPKRLRRTGVCSGHSSYLTHIDFSTEGALLQSTCGANELLYWQVPNGAQNPQSQDIKDTKWHTQTCHLGWALKSIWPPGSDGTDINAVARTHHPAKPTLLATVDDFGHVKLFRYPVVGSKQRFRAYLGHSSHVINARFTECDKYLITAGGADNSLFQWRLTYLYTGEKPWKKAASLRHAASMFASATKRPGAAAEASPFVSVKGGHSLASQKKAQPSWADSKDDFTASSK